MTGLSHQPFATAAAAAATELEPDAVVSPAPRSQIPMRSSCGPTTRTNWTLVRSGKRSWFSTSGPSSAISASAKSRRITACGFPTETGVKVRRSPPTSSSSGGPTSTAPTSSATIVPSTRAVATRVPKRSVMSGPALLGEPRGGDPRTVPGELRLGAVRVPDLHVGLSPVRVDDLDDPVGVGAQPLNRRHVERPVELRPLEHEVGVTERVPFGGSHPRCRPAGGRLKP